MKVSSWGAKVEVEFRFRFRHDTELTFRLSSPTFVDMCRNSSPSAAAAARRRAAQPRARSSTAARAVFAEHGPRRADGRRRPARRGRRRHRLPPLPDQGGAARGARARRFERDRRLRRARRSSVDDPWEAFVDAAVARRRDDWPATARFTEVDRRAPRRRSPIGAPSSRAQRDRWRADARARRRPARCAPTSMLDDIPMIMCGIGSGDAQARTAARRPGAATSTIVLDGLRAASAAAHAAVLACGA